MTREAATLKLLQQDAARGPVLVHADLMRTRCFTGLITSRAKMLGAHLDVLIRACGDRPLWAPCFNYDFCGSGRTDLQTAKCQVGPLGEALRDNKNFWRSTDPVFSICGNGARVEAPASSTRFAFDDHSGWGQLYDRGGSVLLYGASLHSATILHFAETRAGGPVYRYDKTFSGSLTDACGETGEIDYVYHVRPMGMSLDYDWGRIHQDLVSADLITEQIEGNQTVAQLIAAVPLVDFWCLKLESDPLYFLDPPTRAKVEALNLPPGGRVQQADFE